MAMREKSVLNKLQFEFLILDEAQRIKNDQSKLSQVLRNFKAGHRLLLTGTPLQNNLTELWALLNFLMPKLFDSSDEFNELFRIDSDASAEEAEKQQQKIIQHIHRLLRPFMLRRLKSDVETSLKPKKEIYLYVGMSTVQKQLYKSILSGNIDVVNSQIGQGADKIKLLNVLMQLKKVCNHPYLFDNVEPGPPFVDGEHLVTAAQKFKVMDLLIPKLLKQGFKILIFSQMTRLMNILDDYIRFRGYNYCRIDGQTSALDRETRIEDFQRADSDKEIFILSTRAGGLGINLHRANIVILFDSDWNPQVDLQAIDRAHRIGQKKQVIVYRLVTEGSVEEKIVERAARKLKVDHLIMQKGQYRTEKPQSANNVSQQEMLQMIKYGAQEIISTAQQEITEENIDAIIDHSLKKTAQLNQTLDSIEDKFNLNSVSLTGDEPDNKQSSLYTFEGQDYKKGKEEKDQPLDFIDIGRRGRNQQSYNIDSYYRYTLTGAPVQTGIEKEFKEKKKLKGWKVLAGGGYDHQFFDHQTLDMLDEKERKWAEYRKKQDAGETPEQVPEFSEEDYQKRQDLISQGWPTWNKKDFFNFVRMCEKFGRDADGNFENFREALPLKKLEEIKRYSEAFWSNFEKIENGPKYVERIEKGELEIRRRQNVDLSIQYKFDSLIQNYKEQTGESDLKGFQIQNVLLTPLKKPIPYVTEFSVTEDQILTLGLYKYGYGFWELIRNDLRNCPALAFNWIARSRTSSEIQKRCDQLIQQFQKETMPEVLKESKNSKSKLEDATKPKNKDKSSLGKRSRGDNEQNKLQKAHKANNKVSVSATGTRRSARVASK